MNKIYKVAIFSIVLLMMGCATNRGVIGIEDSLAVNPTEGLELKIVRINDNRDFQLKPKAASTPSLKNGEINDSRITSRAIARKRNTYGKALGDILLPEGKTVMDVVQDRIERGLKESGYIVLAPGSSNYADAIPVEVDINKFWGWFSPGFWSIGLNFQTAIVVRAPMYEFGDGLEFNSEVQKRFQTASGGNWKKVIDLSLDELNANMHKKINTAKSTL